MSEPNVTYTLGQCRECGGEISSRRTDTEPLQEYGDGRAPAPSGDPRRLVLRPDVRMVPGPSVTTVWPCGHSWRETY